MKDMVQTMASSDNVFGTESIEAWCDLFAKELVDESHESFLPNEFADLLKSAGHESHESFLPNEFADLLKSAGHEAVRQSVDASLRLAAARDFDAYISIWHGHSDKNESLAREALSGHH
jgi:hypothetical protein